MSRFNDEDHLTAYRATGKLPKIHAPLVQLIREETGYAHMAAIDLGSSLSLLSIRLQDELALKDVVGFEPGKDYERRVSRHGVTAYRLGVRHDTIWKVCEIARSHGATLAVARRVFPEIAGDDPSVISAIGAKFAEAGILEIAVEGRVPVAKPAHKLWCVELEVERLIGPYRVKARKGACVLMELS